MSPLLRSVLTVGVAMVVSFTAGPAFAASSLDDDGAGVTPVLGSEPSPSRSVELDPNAEYVYPGDPAAEAALVASEDRRLVDVDLVVSGVLVPELDRTHPFRVSGSTISTLVLTARDSVYTLDELNEVAPQSVVDLGDGSYRLTENIVILPGATFVVSGRGPVELQLASQPEGFVSVISMGGSLMVKGTPESPARVRSWNTPQSANDTDTADGRAYLRAIGGQISISNAQIENLGFWSGNTGGLALTGTDEAFGVANGLDTVREESASDGAAADVATSEGSASPEPAASGELTTDAETEKATAASLAPPTGEAVVDPGTGESLIPMGVTAWLSNVSVVGNTFGMFVSNAEQVEIRDSYVADSLVDGVVFHREVKRSSVVNTESSRNAGDGFRISRGSNGILLDSVTADSNGGDGIAINAAPLATGPSAVGLSTESYGDHIVRDSVLSSNAVSGIELSGGTDIQLMRNTVTHGEFGIVIREAAQVVSVQDNTITDSAKQGIAVRDGVEADLTGNTIDGTVTGIYSRDSVVDVVSNYITGVTNHAVTITGTAEGSTVEKNTLAGIGSSAIDVFRADAVEVSGDNDITSWSTKSVQQAVVDSVTKPLTMMWILLGALLVFTAFMGIRHRRLGIRHPYKDRTPLSELTAGMVDPSSVEGVNAPGQADNGSELVSVTSTQTTTQSPDLPVRAEPEGPPRLANPGRARRADDPVTAGGLPRKVGANDQESVGV